MAHRGVVPECGCLLAHSRMCRAAVVPLKSYPPSLPAGWEIFKMSPLISSPPVPANHRHCQGVGQVYRGTGHLARADWWPSVVTLADQDPEARPLQRRPRPLESPCCTALRATHGAGHPGLKMPGSSYFLKSKAAVHLGSWDTAQLPCPHTPAPVGHWCSSEVAAPLASRASLLGPLSWARDRSPSHRRAERGPGSPGSRGWLGRQKQMD